MPTLKSITEIAATKLKAKPGQKQTDYFDRNFPGLALRVSEHGRKSWTYFYRVDGKQKRLTFDTYPALDVAGAHDAWRAARDAVRTGRDPGGTSKAPSSKFESVFADWMKRDQDKNRSARVVRKSIERDVLPYWRDREIGDIGRRDCLDVIDRVVDSDRPIEARRLQSRLHRLFQWAIGRGIVTANPLTGVERPGADIPRERALSDDELTKVWNAAEQLGYPYGTAYQLLILTGARRDEIGSLRWSEKTNGLVKLPSERTKNGEPHVIPLSAPAKSILDSLPRFSDFVFTHRGHRGLGAWAKAKKRLDALSGVTDWHVHDLRRTLASGLQKLKVPLVVTESVLGHVSGSRSGIVGVYQQHDYAEEKAAALEAWGAHVVGLVEGRAPGKVVAFGGR